MIDCNSFPDPLPTRRSQGQRAATPRTMAEPRRPQSKPVTSEQVSRRRRHPFRRRGSPCSRVMSSWKVDLPAGRVKWRDFFGHLTVRVGALV